MADKYLRIKVIPGAPKTEIKGEMADGTLKITVAAPPEKGLQLFSYLQSLAKETYDTVEFGRFGADMKVSLLNDGPVTFMLKS